MIRFHSITAANVARVTGWLLLPMLLLALTGARAEYPERPITGVVPFGTGGPSDLISRLVATAMSKELGQSIVILNKPGGGGNVGMDFVVKSKPDGYTLLFSTSGHTSVSKALLTDKLPFDPFRELTPVTLLVLSTQMLLVHPSLGVKNVPDFVKLMKANPGKYSYGSAGIGTPNFLGVELLKYLGGFDMLHVPYKGGAQVVVDLVAGRTQLTINSMVPILPHVNSGKIIPIGVGSARRSPSAPDVPTVIEQGYPEYEVYTWYGMFAPANLPRDITMKLNGILNDALKQPDVVKTFIAQGAEPAGGTPENLARMMRSEYERWRKVVVAAKIEVDQ